MQYFSDTRETSARYGSYIAEFQELCKRHEVASGTPEDFYRLAPKLAYDEGFRADFCTLTKSVAQREDGKLTLTQILTIIAIAMGGQKIDTIGTAGAVPVSLVVVFLAGVGGWNEDESPTAAPTDPLTAIPPQPIIANGERPLTGDEREALEFERRLAGEPNDLRGVAASLFGNPAMVKEALGRLELHTLELKLHLDSIDSRMERIEPHLDDLTSRLSTVEPKRMEESQQVRGPLPVVRYSQPALRVAPVAEVPIASKPEPLAFAPKIVPIEPQPAPVPIAEPQVKPSSQARELKEAYETRRMYRVLSALAVLLVVTASILGFLLFTNSGRSIRSGVGRILGGTVDDASAKTVSSISSVSEVVSPNSPAKTAEVIAVPPKTAAARSTGKQKPESPQKANAALPSGAGDAAKKISVERATEEAPPKSSTIHPADASPQAMGVNSPGVPGDRRESTESAGGGGGDGAASGGRTKVFVPASALVGSAIASPAPVYPSTARMKGVEGEVVLQALISEKGTVESVSVVSGPAPLQSAAVDALRRWRFRPYQLDGHPVAVRTFVDFSFKMNY